MAYSEFAFFYDELNGDADYDRLFEVIHHQLLRYGCRDGILADLGCGTGELTLRLLEAGYDMIGIDTSSEMLSVVADKQAEMAYEKPALLLHQDICNMDLYGTVQGMVSTFDTFNHIPPDLFENAIKRTALFMDKNAVFVFDMNTPYKHRKILENNHYTLVSEEDGAVCDWQNTLDETNHRTKIDIEITYSDEAHPVKESFYEYYYPLDYIREMCERYGLSVVSVIDGETFDEVKDNSARYLITAVKQYTQNEEK